MKHALAKLLEQLEASAASDCTVRLRTSRVLSPELLTEARAGRADQATLMAEQAADDAEREAIRTEPPLPAEGTPEWQRQDQRQREMVAGLLRSAILRLPVSADPASPPPVERMP